MGQLTTWYVGRERRACGSRADPLLWLATGHDRRRPAAAVGGVPERNIALCGRLALPPRTAAGIPDPFGAGPGSDDAERQVDLACSLREACANIASALGSGRVAFRLELAGLACPAERSVPVALIAGELVTNALKHAFPRGRRGRVHVRLAPDGAGRALLSVSDDGVGLPAAAARGRTSGLRLVDEMAAELGGTVVTVRGDGTCVSLCWPL